MKPKVCGDFLQWHHSEVEGAEVQASLLTDCMTLSILGKHFDISESRFIVL